MSSMQIIKSGNRAKSTPINAFFSTIGVKLSCSFGHSRKITVPIFLHYKKIAKGKKNIQLKFEFEGCVTKMSWKVYSLKTFKKPFFKRRIEQ